jgi:hypothetical protein
VKWPPTDVAATCGRMEFIWKVTGRLLQPFAVPTNAVSEVLHRGITNLSFDIAHNQNNSTFRRVSFIFK